MEQASLRLLLESVVVLLRLVFEQFVELSVQLGLREEVLRAVGILQRPDDHANHLEYLHRWLPVRQVVDLLEPHHLGSHAFLLDVQVLDGLREVAEQRRLGVAVGDVDVHLVDVALVRRSFGTIYHYRNLLDELEAVGLYLADAVQNPLVFEQHEG